MSAILSDETHLTISQVAKRAPGNPHIATVWRWCLKGVRGVKLESFVCGGKRLTSVEALERFICRTTQAADGATAQVSPCESRQREIYEAEGKCEAAGI